VTPTSIRLRKRSLRENERKRSGREAVAADQASY
jgi:predicted membrane GTPase involved in stress response